MESLSLISIFKNSAKNFVKNPILALPTFLSILFITLFSLLSVRIVGLFSGKSQIIPILWPIIFVLLSLIVLAYLFAGLISLCFALIKGKAKMKDFFSGANKYWMKNFVVILIIY